MFIIADNRIPQQAKDRLSEYGDIIHFSTEGLTYEAISGHPDIFFCQVNGQLIIAPNLPDLFKNILSKNNIPFIEGEAPVGKKYPKTAHYNIVATENYLIHNFRYTDSVITKLGNELDLIHSDQGYTRCNLIPLTDDHFITSDEGIRRVIQGYNLPYLFIDPKDILLPGVNHGFFGGACGVHEDKFFIVGSLSKFNEGEKVGEYLNKLNYKIIELYDGLLFDGGSLFFI
ncbi:MAG: hypothetical protein K8R86_10830 [Bacteroidales bacterium]|nr:hypothetical protein [Bacteroidales bacterium]